MGLTVDRWGFSLVAILIVHFPLLLGPSSFGAGSFRGTRVQGESLASLITHISIVAPICEWDGPIYLGG